MLPDIGAANRGKTKRRVASSTLRQKRPLTSDLAEELKEAREQQGATARILKVIASSPDDVQPVMKAIVESACELCGAYDAVGLLRDGDDLLFSAHHGPVPMHSQKRPINRSWAAGRAVIERKAVHTTICKPSRANFRSLQR